ncbi:class II fructose-bisphosphate aldolase [Candidatus Phytoplasma melaleucae]|uniref:Ketose-bisphosphate aldolase n=1 Tax=Candidatus Phytoplasma melaleucae TaxID=2982630 RepID=A0ABT9DE84_9MOLU|nr:ketose-bisphosphate aldolase ['Melaleuca sp.' phytoplasma]MDO8167901.1 ketose-bisphosphate aldolase ['Melaleuca sp.' phytoplasma]MDV3205192.1 ketose-bisphosphate aldolase [Weeping tea tree witches'-broom phytoplasma]
MLSSNKEIILKAYRQNYAIIQVNINNLEWVKAALETAQELCSPIILGVSETAAQYMGGFKTVFALVKELDCFYNITVPVILHLDHGSEQSVEKAIEAGFNSVMLDQNHFSLSLNAAKICKIIQLCRNKKILIETETSEIYSSSDVVNPPKKRYNLNECQQFIDLGVDMLAVNIGNMHGRYPDQWLGLDLDILIKIREKIDYKIPFVLHGGSGVPDDMIHKAINLGIVKININTEFQITFAQAIRRYIEAKKDLVDNGFNPRKLLNSGFLSIKKAIKNKLILFRSANQA